MTVKPLNIKNMKTMNFIKSLLVLAIAFIANLTVSASNPEISLVYNTEEINGVRLSETVYHMSEGILTHYAKYNYKYNDNKQVVENLMQKWDKNSSEWKNDMCIKYLYTEGTVTMEYYKWNKKSNEFVLVPNMTVTMNK